MEQTASQYLAFAHTLADAAGEVLREYFRTRTLAERKGDESPVTVADREAETVMRAMIEKEYPAHGVFGEEHARINPAARLQWVLDPIDGTRSFMAGYPIFTTLIALCEDGRPVLGVIDQPVLRERWSAAVGGQTLLNGEACHVRTSGDLAKAVVATTSTGYFMRNEREGFEALRKQSLSTVHGGDGYAYAMLATGQLDAVVDAQMKPYDFCALVPVVAGAGGVITDWAGAPLMMHSRGQVLAVGDKVVHDACLGLLKP